MQENLIRNKKGALRQYSSVWDEGNRSSISMGLQQSFSFSDIDNYMSPYKIELGL